MKAIIKGFLVTLFAIGATNVHGAQKAATKQLKKATALIASNPNQAKKLIATALRNIAKVKGSAQQQLQAQAQKLQAQLLAKPIVKPVVKPTAKPVFKPAKVKPPKPAQQQAEAKLLRQQQETAKAKLLEAQRQAKQEAFKLNQIATLQANAQSLFEQMKQKDYPSQGNIDAAKTFIQKLRNLGAELQANKLKQQLDRLPKKEASTTTPPLVSQPVSVAALPSSSSVPPSIPSADPLVVRPRPAYAHTIKNLSPIVKRQERASCGFHAAKNAKYILEWLNARDIIDSARNQNLINQATKTQHMGLIMRNRDTWLATSGPDLGQCRLTNLNLDEIKDRAARLAINPQQFNIIQDMSLNLVGYKNREEEIYKLADFIEKIEKGQSTFHAFIVGSMQLSGQRGTYGHWIAIVVDFHPDTGVTYYVADSIGGSGQAMVEALKLILNKDPLELRNEIQLLTSDIQTFLSTAGILMDENNYDGALRQIYDAINAIKEHNLPLTEELHIILKQITGLLDIIDASSDDKELGDAVETERERLKELTKKLQSPQQQVAPAVQVVRPPVSRQTLNRIIRDTKANEVTGKILLAQEQQQEVLRQQAKLKKAQDELKMTPKDIAEQKRILESIKARQRQ